MIHFSVEINSEFELLITVVVELIKQESDLVNSLLRERLSLISCLCDLIT